MQEGDQGAHRDDPRDHPASAHPDQQAHPQRGDQLHAREEDGVVEDGTHVGVPVGGVDLLELAVGPLLPVEELHDGHAGEVLLEEGADAGDLHPHLAEAVPHLGLEPEGQQEEQGDDRESHQGQPPVHPEKHGDDARQQHQVAEDGDDARREHLVQGVHVRGHPGHQPADGIAVVEGQGQALEMAEDLPPQIVHDVLPHELEDVALGVEGHEGEHQGGQIDGRDGREALHRHVGRNDPPGQEMVPHPDAGRRDLALLPARVDEEVEGHRRGQGSHELEQRGAQDERQSPRRHAPVRADIPSSRRISRES